MHGQTVQLAAAYYYTPRQADLQEPDLVTRPVFFPSPTGNL